MQPSIQAIPCFHLASGDILSIQLFRFIPEPKSEGQPKVYIQSNLHGAEIVGNAVIEQLLEWLSSLEPHQLKAEVWIVPLCNPVSANQRNHYFSTGRFNPYDGKDWNRIFWEYETDLMSLTNFAEANLNRSTKEIQASFSQMIFNQFQELAPKLRSPSGAPLSEHFRFHLQSLCLDANYIIDIHSTSNQGLNYLYYFSRREQSAQSFDLRWGILLDLYDGNAFDEAFMKPWLALEDCFTTLGRPLCFDKEAWTLELGNGMQMNPESVRKGVAGIQNYLIGKQVVVDGTHPLLPTQSMAFTSTSKVKKYYAPYGGVLFLSVTLGQTVQPGQLLYELLCFSKQSNSPARIKVAAEQEGTIYDFVTNQSLNQGEYVLSVF